jgi:hypothetical protein
METSRKADRAAAAAKFTDHENKADDEGAEHDCSDGATDDCADERDATAHARLRWWSCTSPSAVDPLGGHLDVDPA